MEEEQIKLFNNVFAESRKKFADKDEHRLLRKICKFCNKSYLIS